MLDQLGEHCAGGVDVGVAIEPAESFLDVVVKGDFAVRVAQVQ
ncbi:hypothetical protein LAUMK136_04423 [Mycobacterium attenuatum]|uniref:Uncharacterized protein n=1 Tax=Mycobacterium attenuatum TaxID=2341086 RepID=A0A498Q9Z6_9MYCO|nr:hypothetical protein [Mycobacterium attenuatum]VBA42141.1 hypothetical protein LAUMK136_04423 [Mycobacterium attenuatum]